MAAAWIVIHRRAGTGNFAHVHRPGRVEREVVAAAAGARLLVVARSGDLSALGPRSLGPHARFVVDHAPLEHVETQRRPSGLPTLPVERNRRDRLYVSLIVKWAGLFILGVPV